MPKTPSFVTEIELNIEPQSESVLNVRFDCARQIYNACLGEALIRLRLMRDSPIYQAANAMPRTVNKEPNLARQGLFNQAREIYGFREYDLHSFSKQFSHSWLGDHVDSGTVQKIATRAFKAVSDYCFGKHGKPRFKGKKRFDSVEGKSNDFGIRFKDNADRGRTIIWGKLLLPLLIKPADPIHAHGLNSPVKYVRIVRREIRGTIRWFAQLINEGLPYRKPKNVVTPGVVGLDIGPSTVAIVSQDYADLRRFCDQIGDKAKKIAKYQRKIERQRRAANPGNYNPDKWVKNANGTWKHKKGTIKKGVHKWAKSTRMEVNQRRLRGLHGKLSAHRKSLQGALVNDVLAQGSTIKLEKLSYKAFQRMFGKSVGKRAPSMFVAHLSRKAESAGGAMIEFSTWNTRLSQTCHGCGSVVKKPLKQRWHVCECGIVQQRDLYSAFLATCIEDSRLVASIAKESYAAIDYALRAAASRNQSVIGQASPPNFALTQSQNGSPALLESLSENPRIEQLRLFPLVELSL